MPDQKEPKPGREVWRSGRQSLGAREGLPKRAFDQGPSQETLQPLASSASAASVARGAGCGRSRSRSSAGHERTPAATLHTDELKSLATAAAAQDSQRAEKARRCDAPPSGSPGGRGSPLAAGTSRSLKAPGAVVAEGGRGRRRRSKSPADPREEASRVAALAARAPAAVCASQGSLDGPSTKEARPATTARLPTPSSVASLPLASESACDVEPQGVGGFIEMLKSRHGCVEGQRLKVVGEAKASLRLESGKMVPKSQLGKNWRWAPRAEERAEPEEKPAKVPDAEEDPRRRRLAEMAAALLEEWAAQPESKRSAAFSEIARVFRARVPAECLAEFFGKPVDAAECTKPAVKPTADVPEEPSAAHGPGGGSRHGPSAGRAPEPRQPAAPEAAAAAPSSRAGGRGCYSRSRGRCALPAEADSCEGSTAVVPGAGCPCTGTRQLPSAAVPVTAAVTPTTNTAATVGAPRGGGRELGRGRSPGPGADPKAAAAAAVVAAAAAAAKDAALPAKRPRCQSGPAEERRLGVLASLARTPTPGRATGRPAAATAPQALPGTPVPGTPVVATAAAVRERSRSRRSPIAAPHVPMVGLGELVGQAR